MAHIVPRLTLLNCPYPVVVAADDIVNIIKTGHSPIVSGGSLICGECGERGTYTEHIADVTARLLLDRLIDLKLVPTRN